MQVIADLHLHSRFSRAVSQEMNLPKISLWATRKGIGLVGTGDWTHPMWYREIKSQLSEVGEGVYRLNSELKTQNSKQKDELHPLFLLSTELSCIYSQDGKSRRVHVLVFAPNIGVVEKINKDLSSRGLNLFSDGRPILGIPVKNLTEIILNVDEKCLVIPAHIWTPWFSMYGSMSGFDSIEECFGDYSKYIYAVETGLSSDPAMNWRVEELKERRILSFGDSHSPQKLGREATVFQIQNSKLNPFGKLRIDAQRSRSVKNQNDNSKFKINYQDILDAIKGTSERKWKIGYTIEFYPEEGKYHYSGHKACKVVYSANDVRKKGGLCPVCGKTMTIGVTYRVEKLSSGDVETESILDDFGVRYIKDRKGEKVPYVMLVPLLEILSESLGSGVSSKKTTSTYEALINKFGTEFGVLLNTQIGDIENSVGKKIAEAVSKVRKGDIVIEPGYDGVFGKVAIWSSGAKSEGIDAQSSQNLLF